MFGNPQRHILNSGVVLSCLLIRNVEQGRQKKKKKTLDCSRVPVPVLLAVPTLRPFETLTCQSVPLREYLEHTDLFFGFSINIFVSIIFAQFFFRASYGVPLTAGSLPVARFLAGGVPYLARGGQREEQKEGKKGGGEKRRKEGKEERRKEGRSKKGRRRRRTKTESWGGRVRNETNPPTNERGPHAATDGLQDRAAGRTSPNPGPTNAQGLRRERRNSDTSDTENYHHLSYPIVSYHNLEQAGKK